MKMSNNSSNNSSVFQQINDKCNAESAASKNGSNGVSGRNGFARVGAILTGTVKHGRNAINVHLNSDQQAFMYRHDCITDVQDGDEITVEVITVEDGRHGGQSIRVKEYDRAA